MKQLYHTFCCYGNHESNTLIIVIIIIIFQTEKWSQGLISKGIFSPGWLSPFASLMINKFDIKSVVSRVWWVRWLLSALEELYMWYDQAKWVGDWIKLIYIFNCNICLIFRAIFGETPIKIGLTVPEI